ncbi:hypothetical protein B0I32_102347 [Nonomuraea fuscirosea]|uniref:Uncharacterized protein n=1 Tax=Nonomuraea fuscirosea TaxID=1291556 RepID=A0A2T0N9A2_9ACTN|nr:hypothetical protein [Nonomuraea fuscirosea]PRX69290.1 hypothetical protein B0I32_102347 [Nonomuraea fuscirosea]
MTQPPDEYGDLLRRALRAEADAVVPSPEGLEIIRGRIERRGVRNLFWWRAGAAAASALLVAGTIVMAVPSLRSQIIDQIPAAPIDNETTSEAPSNSSTTRSVQPPPPERTTDPPAVVIPETPKPPTPRTSRKADSTSRPSPSPSPTPTDCPSTLAEQTEPPADCPTLSPSPTPTPTMEETSVAPTACPPEECPPTDDAMETPADLASPLQDTSDTTVP